MLSQKESTPGLFESKVHFKTSQPAVLSSRATAARITPHARQLDYAGWCSATVMNCEIFCDGILFCFLFFCGRGVLAETCFHKLTSKQPYNCFRQTCRMGHFHRGILSSVKQRNRVLHSNGIRPRLCAAGQFLKMTRLCHRLDHGQLKDSRPENKLRLAKLVGGCRRLVHDQMVTVRETNRLIIINLIHIVFSNKSR